MRNSKQLLRERRELWAPKPISLPGKFILAAFIGGFITLCIGYPFVLLPVAGIMVLAIWTKIAHSRRMDRMASERQEESICQFARALRSRDFDPIVVRAVYETVQNSHGRSDVAVRPTDNLARDYQMVEEDIDDVLIDSAQLALRCVKDTTQNPLYGKVTTTGDLVRFLQNQPVMLAETNSV